MSLFEWLGERRNPGPVGTIDGGPPEPVHRSGQAILLRGAVALGLALSAVVASVRGTDSLTDMIALIVATAIYCALAYNVSPRPETSNVGWAGGLVDHPFRWSDDVNRMLVALTVVLWPGRFVTVSIRDLVGYRRGRRFIVLPP